MTFVGDPNALRVIDPERGYALEAYFHDVPKDERWFSFLFEDIEFIAKAKYSWSKDDPRSTYVFQIEQLEHSLRTAPSRRRPRYNPSPQEFREAVLPALRDAIVALVRHTIYRGPRERLLNVPGRQSNIEVIFTDVAPDGGSKVN